MPELPEVETIRRQLEKVLKGSCVSHVQVLREKSWEGNAVDLVGLVLTGISRRGKALVLEFGLDSERVGKTNPLVVLVHLKMTGQLIWVPLAASRVEDRIVGGHPTEDFVAMLPSKHTRVVISFTLKDTHIGTLYFNDQRMFGWMKLMTQHEMERVSFIKKLAQEPWQMELDDFKKIMHSSRKAVKVRLMDQEAIAGVGNIYANDACWEAGISPVRQANSLSSEEVERLFESVKKILDEGIMHGGATAMDGKYVDLHGLGGTYQEHFKVYQRDGEGCLREGCDGVIVKKMVGGRGTFWCERCQK